MKLHVAFKNYAPFTRCVTHINDKHNDAAKNLDITMSMFNLTKYSSNYSETSGSLWQFKTDESHTYNNENFVEVATDSSTSFNPKG